MLLNIIPQLMCQYSLSFWLPISLLAPSHRSISLMSNYDINGKSKFQDRDIFLDVCVEYHSTIGLIGPKNTIFLIFFIGSYFSTIWIEEYLVGRGQYIKRSHISIVLSSICLRPRQQTFFMSIVGDLLIFHFIAKIKYTPLPPKKIKKEPLLRTWQDRCFQSDASLWRRGDCVSVTILLQSTRSDLSEGWSCTWAPLINGPEAQWADKDRGWLYLLELSDSLAAVFFRIFPTSSAAVALLRLPNFFAALGGLVHSNKEIHPRLRGGAIRPFVPSVDWLRVPEGEIPTAAETDRGRRWWWVSPYSSSWF